MKLYWFKAQAPLRVLALVKYLGIEADCIEVDMMGGGLRTAQYTALNPNQKAPVLIDGDLTLWETAAIMAYLCIKAESNLWPAHDPAEQVEVLRWLSWNDCHWAPAVAPFYFEHVVKSTFGLGPPDRALLEASHAALERYGSVLDAHLASTSHVACDRLTIADFQMASMARYWQQSAMPFAGFSHIVAWLDELAQIPAWAEPWPVARHGVPELPG